MDALRQPRFAVFGDAEQFHPVAQVLGVGDVHRVHAANALDVDRIEVDPGAEGEAGEDGEFVRGVDAVDVEARIGLGVAQRLRVGERGGEGAPALAHVGEHVVAGAVEDSVNSRHPVGGQALAQRLDDGDGAGDGGLEAELRAVRLGAGGERGAAAGDQRLVRRHDVDAPGERAVDQFEGRAVLAADELHRDVEAGGGERRRVVMPLHPVERNAAVAVAIARGDRGDLEAAAAARREQLRLAAQERHRRRADRAEAGDADAERGGHDAAARRSAGGGAAVAAAAREWARNARRLRAA